MHKGPEALHQFRLLSINDTHTGHYFGIGKLCRQLYICTCMSV